MLIAPLHRLRRLGRDAVRDRRGVAAVEFALIAPVMILLFFGMTELSSAIIASRHANHATSSLGDLAGQCANINDSDIANMFSGASDIMAPLPITAANSQNQTVPTFTQRVTSVVVTDANGTTKVAWSQATPNQTSLTAYTPGQTITVPANLVSAQGDSVIMAESTYNFSFPVNILNNLIKFDDLSYFKPRRSAQVVYTGAASGGGNGSGTSCYAS